MVNLLPSPEPTPLSAEDRYRLLAENSSDIVYQTAGLNIIWISPSVTTALGWTEADLIGQPAQKLVSAHQDLSWIIRNRVELEQGLDVAQEMLLTAKNGDELWFSGVAHPVHDDGGALEGFVVGMRNIDQKVQTRKRLQESEEKFRAAMVNAAVAVAITDKDDNILEVNEAMLTFLGRSFDDIRGKKMDDFATPEDEESDTKLFDELISGQRDFYRTTTSSTRPDGLIFFGDLSISVVRDEDGEDHGNRRGEQEDARERGTQLRRGARHHEHDDAEARDRDDPRDHEPDREARPERHAAEGTVGSATTGVGRLGSVGHRPGGGAAAAGGCSPTSR